MTVAVPLETSTELGDTEIEASVGGVVSGLESATVTVVVEPVGKGVSPRM